MGKCSRIELTKIKQIVADIREFPAKIDSVELAKNARRLLRKYALLSEKIERNVLIGLEHQKDLSNIRTKEFKGIRRTLKEKANSILLAKNNESSQSKKITKKTEKIPSTKKTSKDADTKVAKQSDAKKSVKKSSPKPQKEDTHKKDA